MCSGSALIYGGGWKTVILISVCAIFCLATATATTCTPATTQVNHVNVFFYNIPSSGVGLPLVELYWGDTSQRPAENHLSHVIVGNQDLSQNDKTLRSVSLVITNNTQTDYKSFRICFIFPETSLIDRIILSEIQFCEEAVPLPMSPITFLQPPSFEPPVPPGPDSVVSAANLSCTVANEGSFQWQWTLPLGITFTQMWLADGTRTSIGQISQISSANAGTYTCTASFNGQSADNTISIELVGRLISSSSNVTVPTSNPLATLSCELYGYHPELLPTTVWNFGRDNLTNDSIYTITTEDGSHMIQNGGNTPRPSVRSVLTINHPNTTHMGTYFCSAGGRTSTIHFQVVEAENTNAIIGLSVGLSLGAAILIATVVITALCVWISRKERSISTESDAYEIVDPPQLPVGSHPNQNVDGEPRELPPGHPNMITTEMNPAYASSIQTHPNDS